MKVGLLAVVSGRVGGMAVMKAFAENAERVGFSTLWAPEHVVLLDSCASRYPYRDDGTLPAPTDAPIADPFGFPLRLRTATKLGFKNAKWVNSIEVTNDFPDTYYRKEGFNWFAGI